MCASAFLLSTVLTAGCTAKQNENRKTVTPAASAPAKASSPAKNVAPAVPALVEVNEQSSAFTSVRLRSILATSLLVTSMLMARRIWR